jgi:hypothetical protein
MAAFVLVVLSMVAHVQVQIQYITDWTAVCKGVIWTTTIFICHAT